MFCPQCHEQYPDGSRECEDCHVPLTDRLAEPVFDALIRTGCADPIAIGLAKSLLEEAGIPFFEMSQNLPARQESGNFIGWFDVRVPREREAEAREILQSVEAMKAAPVPTET
jgi:hypothetical protein